MKTNKSNTMMKPQMLLQQVEKQIEQALPCILDFDNTWHWLAKTEVFSSQGINRRRRVY